MTNYKSTALDLRGDVDSIAKLTAAVLAPSVVNASGIPFVTVPDGYRVEDLERMLHVPTRKRGRLSFDATESLIAYLRVHKTPGTVVFADVKQSEIAAVMNHHLPDGEAGWGDWRATCKLDLSPQIKRWKAANSQQMNQDEFVSFLENNRADIREPCGADLMDICRRVAVKKTVEFVSATRLSDGSREFTYNETIRGVATKGAFTVPETFQIAVPFYIGENVAYPVTAFLRYRISEGGLVLWFDLQQLVEAEQAAFDANVAFVVAETGVPVYAGRCA